MPVQNIKVVCGLNNETSIALKERLQEVAAERNLKLQLVSRYRKEGVYQYVMEHPDYKYVILQEVLQSSSPYKAEDVALLTDERDIRVIIVLNKSHAGNRYMRVLYAAGILDALYEEDAHAERIVELLCSGRTRKEARRYYGIESAADVEKALQIIDDDRVKNFLSYIDSGGPCTEVINRYEFVASRMSAAENLHLIKKMDAKLAGEIHGSPIFRYYNDFLIPKPKKRFALLGRREKCPLSPEEFLHNNIPGKAEEAAEYKELEQPEDFAAEKPRGVSENGEAGRESVSRFEDFHEEESLFDLFDDEDSISILHFIGGSPEEKKRVEVDEKVPANESPGISALEKPGEITPNADIGRLVSSPDKLAQDESIKDKQVVEIKPEQKVCNTRKSRKYLPAAVAVLTIIVLILASIIYRSIFVEREIPMIEEVPAATVPESEVQDSENEFNLAEKVSEKAETVEEKEAIDRMQSEEDTESMEEVNEPEEGEGENGQEEGEETEEVEPQTAAGDFTESSENEAGQPQENSEANADGSQTAVSSERAEVAGAEAGTENLETPAEPDVVISTEAIEENLIESTQPDQEDTVIDCNGRIFSGDELESLANELSQEGYSVYVITRNNGEGYFDSSQIRQNCDPACSFLASVTGMEVRLTEQ